MIGLVLVFRHPIENNSSRSPKLTNLSNIGLPKETKSWSVYRNYLWLAKKVPALLSCSCTANSFNPMAGCVREIVNGLITALARAHQSLHNLVCKVDFISAAYNTDGIPFQIAFRPLGTNCNTAQTNRP